LRSSPSPRPWGYEIDLLINRALVYGSLTALLLVLYYAGVATTQAIFRALIGREQQPQPAVVVSTLVIGALFNPLNRRIQSFIDRRFYLRKYDTAKTLETFSTKLRDKTDLNALSDDLAGWLKRLCSQPTSPSGCAPIQPRKASTKTSSSYKSSHKH
jgi:hypothetical protein